MLIGDGRDTYREQTIASAKEHLPRLDTLIEIDDREHRLGFAGAIADGWRAVQEQGADWVFHLELDFVFNTAVPFDRMLAILQAHPYLAQIALKRQPWNDRERAAGGIVEADPDDFTQLTESGDIWTEHRRFWTTNPCLYSANWCRQPWPQESESEGKWTHRLLADPKLRFGLWGAKFDPPMVTHIGAERQGVGY